MKTRLLTFQLCQNYHFQVKKIVVRTVYLPVFKIWFPSYHTSKTSIKLHTLPCAICNDMAANNSI